MAAMEARKKAATQRVSGRWAEATQAIVTWAGWCEAGPRPSLGCQASCSVPVGSGSRQRQRQRQHRQVN